MYYNNIWVKKGSLFAFTFVTLYFISFTLEPDFYLEQYFKLSFVKISVDLLLNVLLCLIIVELSLFINRKMNNIFPWTKYGFRRLVIQSIVQITILFLVILLFSIMIFLIMNSLRFDITELSPENNNYILQILGIMVLMLMVSAITTIRYLLDNWKSEIVTRANHEVKVAESKQLMAEVELQALRLQLDPHFVFNNLSVLSELILQDQQAGFEYTENFAKVYRYLLTNSKKKVIPLAEELKFLNAYLYLLKKRLGMGVLFEIDLPQTKMDAKLPPVTLQLLIENAIKYNRIDKENPLVVRVFTNDRNELVVSNNLLPLVSKPYSSGIGLENIINRYALLSDRRPELQVNELSFTVKIPLL